MHRVKAPAMSCSLSLAFVVVESCHSGGLDARRNSSLRRPWAWPVILLSAAAVTAGCTVCKKGTLPEMSLPAPASRATKPSLAYAVSFLPPDAERNAALRHEFVQQLGESQMFEEVRPQPADADVTLAVELVDVNLSTGKTLMTYLWTGGLWPVSVPYRYELKATARHATGRQQEYAITDESSCRVWSPGLLQHSLGNLVEPRASGIRKNLYRTLLKRVADDGLLGYTGQRGEP
jgi:hypothetical protein